jgi:hypothetical protein
MTDLATLLRDLHDLECTGQGTPETPESPPTLAQPSDLPEAQDIAPRRCDDCGRTSPVLLITDYGGAFCRACVTFPPKRVPAPRPPTEREIELAGKPLLGHSPEGVAVDLKLFGKGDE